MPDQLLLVMIVSLTFFYTIKYVCVVGLALKFHVFNARSRCKGKTDDDDDDDDNSGGLRLPPFNPPPSGLTLEELLVDRLPADFPAPVNSPQRMSR